MVCIIKNTTHDFLSIINFYCEIFTLDYKKEAAFLLLCNASGSGSDTPWPAACPTPVGGLPYVK